MVLISAFLAAGIDNVSTLLFRAETFWDQREIKSELINNFGEDACIYLLKKFVSFTETDRKQATVNHVSKLLKK